MRATLDLISDMGEAGGEGAATSAFVSPLVFASYISTSAMVEIVCCRCAWIVSATRHSAFFGGI